MSHLLPANDEKITFHVIQAGSEVMAIHDGAYSGKSAINPKNANKTAPAVPIWADNGTRWAYWGDNNLLPTSMRQKMELVPIAGAAIAKKINLMQGEGIVWYKTDEYKRVGHQAEPQFLPEVEDFMEENRVEDEWFNAQCADFCLPFNCFSELILSNDKSKITGLYHISAEHARLSKANGRNEVNWLNYSYHFPFSTAENDDNRVVMPLFKWYDNQKFMDGLTGRKFGWHSRFPTPGMIYYARAWHMGLFKDGGWMDVSANVPKIVAAMQTNQISLKYIINYPESYFLFRYPDWHTYDQAERQKKIAEKQADITAYLTGPENVGKSLMTIFRENEVTGAPMGKPEIIAIDDKAKSGTWVPDTSFADSQIVQGMGLDPSQMGGMSDGGKMGSGSGSDKMQSYNQHILLNTPDQRLVLQPLNYISKYNGWGLTAAVKHTTLTTQNESRSGISTAAPTDTPA